MEIYRSYSGIELANEITLLKKQATLYTAQTLGDKSHTKDLQLVTNRLHAATRVRNEVRFRGAPNFAAPDFSNGIG